MPTVAQRDLLKDLDTDVGLNRRGTAQTTALVARGDWMARCRRTENFETRDRMDLPGGPATDEMTKMARVTQEPPSDPHQRMPARESPKPLHGPPGQSHSRGHLRHKVVGSAIGLRREVQYIIVVPVSR